MLSTPITTYHRCGRCAEGRICEQHPDQPWPHGECAGPGVPCPNPECGFSIHQTGLVCPQCRRPDGDIEVQSTRIIRFKCAACGYLWWAEDATT